MEYLSLLLTVLVVIESALVNGQTVNGGHSANIPRNSDAVVFPESWVSDMFDKALVNFTVRGVGSPSCQEHSELYERNLRNYTSWAVKMAESWVRRPLGVLTGNRYHLGIYDECVQVSKPVRGQYCLSEIKLMPPAGKDYSFNRTAEKDYFGNNHAWHTVLGWVDYQDQIQRNILNIGICIPDSCSALDLQNSLQKELDKVFIPEQAKTVVKVEPSMCTISEDMYPYDRAFYVTSAFCLLLILICCAATLQHYYVLYDRQNGKLISKFSNPYIISFSFIKSINDFFKYNKDNKLNIFNGFKFLYMFTILFGHRFMYMLSHSMSYPIIIENLYLYKGGEIIWTNFNAVDPFFFVGGYLVYIAIIPVFMKPGLIWLKLVLQIIKRILRFLPAYCAVMAITANILPHLGDGPLWPHYIWIEAENCKNFWWLNILFISNFVDLKNQCLIYNWYISCDMQFFIVGIIIIYIYAKNNKLGMVLLGSILCMSFLIPFIVTLLMKWEGIVKIYIRVFEDVRSYMETQKSYRLSYMRAIPYFSGLASAFLVKNIKEKNVKYSLTTVYCATLIVFIISTSVQFYGQVFYIRHRPYYPLEQALYSVLSHCTYTALCAYCLVFLETSGYDILTKLFDNRFFVTMGKLSYSVFLVNLIVMMISQSSLRLTIYPSMKTLFELFIYDSVKSYVLAMMLYLIVELPFGNVTRLIFDRWTKKISLNTNEEMSAVKKIDNVAETPNKVVVH